MVRHRETGRHREAFEAWYAADRDYRQSSEKLSIPAGTLRTWGAWFGWRERADRRDGESQAIADRAASRRRAATLQRHQEAAALLITRGVEWLEAHAITTAAEAIRAIASGIKLEREAEELATARLQGEVSGASYSTTLQRQLEQLALRTGPKEAVVVLEILAEDEAGLRKRAAGLEARRQAAGAGRN